MATMSDARRRRYRAGGARADTGPAGVDDETCGLPVGRPAPAQPAVEPLHRDHAAAAGPRSASDPSSRACRPEGHVRLIGSRWVPAVADRLLGQWAVVEPEGVDPLQVRAEP